MAKQKVIVIYDADILSYRAAAAIETRSIKVLHNTSGRVKTFKHRTEFKDFLKQKSYEYVPSEYTITDMQDAEDISHALQIMKNQILTINELLEADKHLLFISGKDNFRDSLPLPTKYKSNRRDLIRPIHLATCKDYLVNAQNAVVINGSEPDDRVIQVGYSHLEKGYKVIIASSDKDAFAYSGLYIYNHTVDKPEVKLIPELGYLKPDSKGKVRGMGFLWFCLQFLVGDSTDCFNPTELCKKKYGEKSAYKLLKDCTTEREALILCLHQYKEWYPSSITFNDWSGKEQTMDYIEIMDMYFKCCRMLTSLDDKLSVVDFYNKYDIDVTKD
jgi:hypothetical protein